MVGRYCGRWLDVIVVDCVTAEVIVSMRVVCWLQRCCCGICKKGEEKTVCLGGGYSGIGQFDLEVLGR